MDRPVAMSEYSPPVGNSREHEFTTVLADALGTVRGIPPGGDYTLGTVVYQAAEEIARLRRALDILGVPAQALKDPDKAPPLRITVEIAKRAMGVVDGRD